MPPSPNEREKRRQELLAELAKRFRESADTLKAVARRIHEAARMHEDNTRRLGAAGTRLRECVEGDTSPLPFTYLEFVEFASAEEFQKFKTMDLITTEEIAAVDWDDLCQKLTG